MNEEEKKIKRAAYMKEYRQKNKVRINAKNKEWRDRNKEKSNSYSRKWYTQNPVQSHTRTKRWRQKNLELARSYTRDWERKNPEKRRAHFLVLTAVRNGTLERPTSCSCCGTAESVIQGHHEDYSKPLDVIWLCRKCHKQKHKVRT